MNFRKKTDVSESQKNNIEALIPTILKVLVDRKKRSDPKSIEPTVAVTDLKFGSDESSPPAPKKKSIRRSKESDAIVGRTLEGVAHEALTNAQLVGEQIFGYAEQFHGLGCSSESDMHGFFDAAECVLAELYHEAGKPSSSPTRLMRLALQYAMDPRRLIEGDIERFHLRWTSNGLEIVEYPSLGKKVLAFPYPGRRLRNIYACKILELLNDNTPQLFALRKLLEGILGENPPEPRTATLNAKRPLGSQIHVDINRSRILLAGIAYSVDLPQAYFVKVIADAHGKFVAGRDITANAMLVGTRPDRTRKGLPREIQELIETKQGRGYRLRVEQLE